MGYGLSAKQVACPRYGLHGSSSGWWLEYRQFDSAYTILDPSVDYSLLTLK